MDQLTSHPASVALRFALSHHSPELFSGCDGAAGHTVGRLAVTLNAHSVMTETIKLSLLEVDGEDLVFD